MTQSFYKKIMNFCWSNRFISVAVVMRSSRVVPIPYPQESNRPPTCVRLQFSLTTYSIVLDSITCTVNTRNFLKEIRSLTKDKSLKVECSTVQLLLKSFFKVK